MKVYLLGHKGWIGQKVLNYFSDKNIDVVYSDYRAEDPKLLKDILDKEVSHVYCCIGRTHGELGGTKYNTIDYLEHDATLYENMNDNLYSPLSIAMFCDKHNIHFTYIGTGCIFEYDENHTTAIGFTEEEDPNFFGSRYSIVKGFLDKLMKNTNALVLRIRMPISSDTNDRNFITKITKYEKICSIPNSMTVLDEMIPLSITMARSKDTGTFNFTNPGTISHNEILEMYKEIVDPSFTWKNFDIDEQNKILKGKRSNNYLNTSKLEDKYIVSDIKTATMKALTKMKENKL